MADLIGRQIGNYQISGVLGIGGMATVYRAQQMTMQRDIAIKVIETKQTLDPEFMQRFEREAQTIAALDHPHIIKVFDFGKQDEFLYLVMELKTGGSLARAIRFGPLELDEVERIIGQLANALDYAHRKDIIHRDLKPLNVLLDESRNAVLSDFGLAKVLGSTEAALTRTGTYVGTPHYMAPERWRGDEATARSDLYAFGVMLYEMLVGHTPFRADTPSSLMYKHLESQVPSLTQQRSDLPPALQSVVNQAMAKHPNDRFMTATEILSAFQAARADQPRNARAKRATPARRTPSKTPIPSPKPVPLDTPTTVTRVVPQDQLRQRRQLLPALVVVCVVALIVGGLLVGLAQQGASAPPARVSFTPEVRTFGGIPMVYVPAGCFQMGSNEGDADEQPIHAVCITQPFWIDKTEVTNKQYGSAGSFPNDAHPRDRVSWAEAQAFCEGRGGRLPTEAEWEYTARGPRNFIYPWGDTFDPARVIYNSTAGGAPTIVGSRPAGASWVGALDMAGNLWEWTADWYSASYYAESPPNDPTGPTRGADRAVRGGSWYGFTNVLRGASRHTVAPTTQDDIIGFRCVRPVLAIPTPLPSGALNAVWQPVEREIGGVPMVSVPPGCFQMGSTIGDADEKPVHEVCITHPFWIDKTEVTNKQYGSAGRFKGDDRPREGITWAEADAMCKQRGARLPTEAEWEYAARGPQALKFPWGAALTGQEAVLETTSNQTTAPVGSRPAGASWVGALDMSGNVSEWVSDWYSEGYYALSPKKDPTGPESGQYRVRRGGSWYEDEQAIRGSVREWDEPTYADDDVGFRCVRGE